MKILVADDDFISRRMLTAQLNKWGYEPIAVASGDEALTALSVDEPPPIAILDWMMPELSGLEICRRLRAAKASVAPIYIVLLTARSSKSDLVTALDAGADTYLAKPIDAEELRARVSVARRVVELQISLRERDEQLRQSQKMEAIGQLAGGIAHDFNNLITVILGFSDLALRRVPESDPTRRNLSEIKRAGERAARLTQQLLAFSRKQMLHPVVLDLGEVVAETESMLQRVIGEDIELRVVLDHTGKAIKADRNGLEQILMNLAVNARDAMQNQIDGRPKLLGINIAECVLDHTITQKYSYVVPGSYVKLSVSDNGCGMSEGTMKKAFEPFFTTKEVGKGTGLGLATVYGIVKQSDGYIWLNSQPGGGTTVDIYFPSAESVREIESTAEVVAVKPIGTGETVLIVEDEGIVRRMTCEILTAGGYRVLEAADGYQALTVSEQYSDKIHLLVTDVVMPEMSGGETARRLVAKRPELRVLYVSGYTSDSEIFDKVQQESAAFLSKPFVPSSLIVKVREVLDAQL